MTPQEIRKWLFGLTCLFLLSETTAKQQLVAKDLDFYNYYDKKREAARAEDQENIRQYIQSLQTKQEKK